MQTHWKLFTFDWLVWLSRNQNYKLTISWETYSWSPKISKKNSVFIGSIWMQKKFVDYLLYKLCLVLRISFQPFIKMLQLCILVVDNITILVIPLLWSFVLFVYFFFSSIKLLFFIARCTENATQNKWKHSKSK